MEIYGVLLKDFTFKNGESPETFIEYIHENELNLPGQTTAGKDACQENPYFGIRASFTKSECEFETIEEVKKFIIKTLNPFIDITENNEQEIRRNISTYTIYTED